MKWALGLFVSWQVQAVPLYLYEIHVAMPTFSPSQGYNDQFTKAFAEVLKQTDFASSCIDLRRLYQFKVKPFKDEKGKKLHVINVLQVLMRAPLDPFPAQLVEALCAGMGDQCRVRGFQEVGQTEDLSFSQLWREQIWQIEGKEFRKKALPEVRWFPQFSSSCTTGETDESIFFSARSKESRELLQRAGMELDKTQVARLIRKNGTVFWGFGQPDLNWIEAPVTATEQPLVPAEILNDLQ